MASTRCRSRALARSWQPWPWSVGGHRRRPSTLPLPGQRIPVPSSWRRRLVRAPGPSSWCARSAPRRSVCLTSSQEHAPKRVRAAGLRHAQRADSLSVSAKRDHLMAGRDASSCPRNVDRCIALSSIEENCLDRGLDPGPNVHKSASRPLWHYCSGVRDPGLKPGAFVLGALPLTPRNTQISSTPRRMFSTDETAISSRAFSVASATRN